ncbi:hypothetical protein [Nonomuraea sp. NPDC050786]|uniref:hypothetical protein n=1 Tax=Nonomuraea sp. NPDC050786 TaxID=3154840 RepID=UPI003401AE9F
MSAKADVQVRAMDEAVQVLTKRLREWAAAPPDQREPADAVARRFITDMNGNGWRFNPALRRPRPPMPDDPVGATARGAALARNLLPKLHDHPEGGQE